MFSNYTDLYKSGHIARVPKIIGTTAREGSSLVTYPINNYTAGPSEAAVYNQTLNTVCQSYLTEVEREQLNLTTYRYEWAGNFSNLVGGVPWLGAYHYSDLYMFFGTYLIAPGYIPDVEAETSRKMQDLLFDFVKDPYSLPMNGWPVHIPSDGGAETVARFGADGKVLQLVSGDEIEGVCHGVPGAVYNTKP